MDTLFLKSINTIPSHNWNTVWPEDYPFTQHAFLAALENSGCTTPESGWAPCHLIVVNNIRNEFEIDNILAIMPLYEKSHSYGEYVFDWGWAEAYERHGLPYYPKLVNAIPFTPSTGPRLGFAKHLTMQQRQDCIKEIEQSIEQRLIEIGGSGFHSLFPNAANHSVLAGTNYMERQGCQFHWFNQDYKDFDAFLSTFSSRKRKSLKKERKKVEDKQIKIQFRCAEEITKEEWQFFYQLYHRTYFKRSGRAGYLSYEFFLTIAQALPKNILLASAHQDSTENPMLAAALYFRDQTTLYGRYWGTIEDIDGLHFETCYYQGIEYAINNKLVRFDPGAQGEHKIQRGFTPILTCSFHKIIHPGFSQAITEFISDEKQQNYRYCMDARNYLPFREGVFANPEPEILLKAQTNPPIS